MLFDTSDFKKNPSCFVVYVHLFRKKIDAEARLEEDMALAQTAGFHVEDATICVLRGKQHPATFMGKGVVERIGAIIAEKKIDVVMIDPEIRPLQQRQLEKIWKCRVFDRTAIILEIFSQRARTAAGSLQVSLAKLLYQKSRLVRTWTHLERQRGGFGFLGGPGESQLELDRRMISEKIAHIEKKLETVSKTRELHRKARKKVPYPIAALVGYTNVGKSTLFNKLTGASVVEGDRPFETLDPTLRQLQLPSGRKIILSDTVGFISDLPETLRKAFEATLEEVQQADVLLHVQDITDPQKKIHKADVLQVLKNMKCSVPVVDVLNKIDLIDEPQQDDGIKVSAVSGKGLESLIEKLEDILDEQALHVRITLPEDLPKAKHFLHEHAHILNLEKTKKGRFNIDLRIQEKFLNLFEKNFKTGENVSIEIL